MVEFVLKKENEAGCVYLFTFVAKHLFSSIF